MSKDNLAEVEEKIKRLNYLEQMKQQLETQDKPKRKGIFKNVLLLLLILLCCVNTLGHVYVQNKYSLLRRDVTLLEEDLRSAASEVRSMQGDQQGGQ